MLHAVIMAGGAGTRFWPASRRDQPKQLLDLAGERTMIQDTAARFTGLADPERTLVVTNERLSDAIRAQLPELPASSVLGEPCKRDTAPCIGLAAALVSQDDPEAIMVVSPADHVISPVSLFQRTIQDAVAIVENEPNCIVTLGVPPTYAASSFGYIERGEPLPNNSEATAFRVVRFREKPARSVAQQYLEQGGFYWNAGIFIWRADTILNALSEREPEMMRHIEKIVAARGQADFEAVFEAEFSAIRGTSIDYAVMEHHDNVAVIEAPFQWDDLGNWSAFARLRGQDNAGSTIVGKHIDVGSSNMVVRSTDEHLVATVGMTDCIIVHTPDATLVANRHDEESIREVVKILEQQDWGEYL